ncbi:MAG: hypothetical protein Q7S25_01350 [Candidatus Limnocylindria bacterium]|nr:hypothetical protein [Candidatus Limnocylindria bacterium]
MTRRRGSSLRALRNFLDSEIPFPKRLGVTARNLALRVTKRQACCGHGGEPGC